MDRLFLRRFDREREERKEIRHRYAVCAVCWLWDDRLCLAVRLSFLSD